MLQEVHPDSSYTVLSDADKNVTHDLLAEARKDLDELDTEISAVEATHHVLQAHRTEKMRQIDRLQGRIAAHKRLPDELIAAIFVQCLQDGVVEVPPTLTTSLPWALSHVCSRWRGIALAEPLLWKCIEVPPTSLWSEDAMELTRHICSHRGGEGNIELLVSAKCRDDWENLLSLASTYPARIHGLILTVMESSFPYLGAPTDAFNFLESLTLLIDDSHEIRNDHDETQVTAFSLAHNLRKVNLWSTPDQLLFSSSWRHCLLFAWDQLTDLGIFTIYPSTCLEVLKECTQLLRFTVTFCPDILDPIGPTCSVSLSHLCSLFIAPNCITNISQFLDALVLPALKQISFGDGFMGSWPQQSILGLLGRSGNAVESFESAAITSPDDFIGLMRAMPQLTRFVASADSSNSSANTIPETVLRTMNSENLAPKLRIFWGWSVLSIRTALDFLDSRWSRDAQGRYEGIRDARLYIEAKDLAPDQVYFLGSLDHLRMHGRKVEVRCC